MSFQESINKIRRRRRKEITGGKRNQSRELLSETNLVIRKPNQFSSDNISKKDVKGRRGNHWPIIGQENVYLF